MAFFLTIYFADSSTEFETAPHHLALPWGTACVNYPYTSAPSPSYSSQSKNFVCGQFSVIQPCPIYKFRSAIVGRLDLSENSESFDEEFHVRDILPMIQGPNLRISLL